MHAASVGEVDLVRLLQEKWKTPYFITTNTLSGLTQAKKFNPHSFLAPLDFSWSIKNWFKKIKIKGLVLIELLKFVFLYTIPATPITPSIKQIAT